MISSKDRFNEHAIRPALQTFNAQHQPDFNSGIQIEREHLPIFTLLQSSGDRFLAALYSLGIIDEIGRLMIDVSHISLPEHAVKQIDSLSLFLNHQIFIELGNRKAFLSYLAKALISIGIIDEMGTLTHGLPNSGSNPIELNQQSIPYREAIEVLIQHGILSDSGALNDGIEAQGLQYTEVAEQVLWDFLNKKDIKIGTDDSLYCCCYVQRLHLLQELAKSSPKPLLSVRIIGGRARQRLIESLEFCKSSIKVLCEAGINQSDAIDFIFDDLLSKPISRRELPDDDIRFKIHQNATKEDLCLSTDSVIHYFCSRFFPSEIPIKFMWVKDHLFTKLNLLFSETNRFSIAALGNEDPLELIFFRDLFRTQLFTDEIEEDITDLVSPNTLAQKTIFYK